MLENRIVQRVFCLLGQLKEPRTVKELAEQSGVDPKTIRRELVRLQRLGFDVRSETEVYGRKTWQVFGPMRTITKLMG